jgi:dCTP deaminase
MIINGNALLEKCPISYGMHTTKMRFAGVSHGLSEAGYDIRIQQNMILHPFSRFRLASSIEHFDMPDDLVAIVHDKSTWARRGLSVFNTVIEPGWKGYLTLELVYHRWIPLRIPAGAGIAQVIFHKTAERAAYNGKYQDQAARPIKAILEGTRP